MLGTLQLCVHMIVSWYRRHSLHLTLARKRLEALPQPGHEAPPWPCLSIWIVPQPKSSALDSSKQISLIYILITVPAILLLLPL